MEQGIAKLFESGTLGIAVVALGFAVVHLYRKVVELTKRDAEREVIVTQTLTDNNTVLNKVAEKFGGAS